MPSPSAPAIASITGVGTWVPAAPSSDAQSSCSPGNSARMLSIDRFSSLIGRRIVPGDRGEPLSQPPGAHGRLDHRLRRNVRDLVHLRDIAQRLLVLGLGDVSVL